MSEIDLDQGIWDEFEDYSGPIHDLNYDLEWDDSEEGEFRSINLLQASSLIC
jgi:predicted hydrolase (HD superfamily)